METMVSGGPPTILYFMVFIVNRLLFSQHVWKLCKWQIPTTRLAERVSRENSQSDKKILSLQPVAVFTFYLTKQPCIGCVSVCFCQGLFWKGQVAQVLVCFCVSYTTHNSSQIRQVTATSRNDSDLKFTSAPAIQICVLVVPKWGRLPP